jgi:RimJ/RimL family protein N-acetyltransferase
MMKMREPITVRGESVLLRGFAPADGSAIDAAAADPDISLYNPVTKPGLEWCAERADWSNGEHASWAIADPDDSDTLLGSVSLHKIDLDQRSCEVGFFVVPAHRGRRVAGAALRAATGFAFTHLDLRRVELFHAVENLGSCRTVEAVGYRLEGVHRESYRYGDGLWHDEHSHARLRSD